MWHGVKIDVTADSTLNHIIFLQVKKSENVAQTLWRETNVITL